VVNHLNTLEATAGAVAGIEKAGTAYAHAADVTVHGDHQSIDDRLIGECGHWDILANNAGWVTRQNIRVNGGNA
jgi:NAD(P)-dependent dehydrogenase (short-subunit alcohol dehydrogenase family)